MCVTGGQSLAETGPGIGAVSPKMFGKQFVRVMFSAYLQGSVIWSSRVGAEVKWNNWLRHRYFRMLHRIFACNQMAIIACHEEFIHLKIRLRGTAGLMGGFWRPLRGAAVPSQSTITSDVPCDLAHLPITVPYPCIPVITLELIPSTRWSIHQISLNQRTRAAW
jgi:hypothetical protein